MKLKRDSKPRRYEQVVEEIQRLIQEGELSPGDLLLPERQLAEALGVSRTSVREGLSALASQGILAFGPAGAFVREVGFDEVLRPLASSNLFAREGVAHLLEVRKVLEAEAARLAAMRADDLRLRQLRDDLHRTTAAVAAGLPLDQVDIDFHVHVAEASENPLIASITRAIFSAMGETYKPSRDEMVSDAPRRAAFIEQHQAVVDAIEARDPEAARQAMYVHLALVEREVGAL